MGILLKSLLDRNLKAFECSKIIFAPYPFGGKAIGNDKGRIINFYSGVALKIITALLETKTPWTGMEWLHFAESPAIAIKMMFTIKIPTK